MTRSFCVGVLLMAVAGCSREEKPTYKNYSELYRDTSNAFVMALRKLPEPVLENEFELDSSWQFMRGDAAEGFVVDVQDVKGASVNLPHRVLMPDTPLWYTLTANISAPGILTINADDGAQLYLNGKRIRRLEGNHFPVDTVGDLTITIRVLNNAMAGGLRKVTFSTTKQFQQFKAERETLISLRTLAQKIVLMNSPSPTCSSLVKRALDERTTEAVQQAEVCLKDFPYLIGPYLTRQDAKTFVARVKTDTTERVTLQWGKAGNMSNTMTEKGPVASFTFPDLEPGHTYQYQIRCNKTVSPLYTFDAGDTADDFSFNVWADSQSGWEAFASQVTQLTPYRDAFGVGVGDLVGNGSNPVAWETFFSILAESAAQRPYYLIPGNHDYDGYYDDLKPALHRQYTAYDPPNYFFWTYGNAAFIALDPNENFPIGIPYGSEQFKWLNEQVQRPDWRNAQWRFVFLHQTLYSQGWEGYHGDSVLRDVLEPLIERAKIDFIVSGHTHDYERLSRNYGDQEVTFVVVGGAGGSLEPPELSTYPVMDTVIKQHHIGRFFLYGDSLRFEATGIDGKLLDIFKRTKK